jgi:hypothetical protein
VKGIWKRSQAGIVQRRDQEAKIRIRNKRQHKSERGRRIRKEATLM